MDSLAILHKMGDITMKHGVKDWKVKVVKNFIFYNVFLIIFPILLLLTRAILSTLGNKIEILPPDNCSVKKLGMRNDALSHSPSSWLSLHLPMKGTKTRFSPSVPFPPGFCMATMYLGTYAKFRYSFTVLFLSSGVILPYLSRYAKSTAVNFRIS